MATHLNNQTKKEVNIPNAKNFRIGIIVSEWHKDVTDALLKGAEETLLKQGSNKENIIVKYVPGSFELTLGAQFCAQYTDVDAIIVLGCVVRGETPHFDYVCRSVTKGITDLNIKFNLPIIFGVLTTNTIEQALERAGGKLGNKGNDCAIAALQMINLQEAFIADANLDDYLDVDWDDEDWDDEDWEDEYWDDEDWDEDEDEDWDEEEDKEKKNA